MIYMYVHRNDNEYDNGFNTGGNGYTTESLSWILKKWSIYNYIFIKNKNDHKWL